MRKFLLSLTVLAGATAVAAGAQAAPHPALLALDVPVYGSPQVQSVQYYEDWRHREWRRREAYERWRREEWHRRHHQQQHYYRGW